MPCNCETWMGYQQLKQRSMLQIFLESGSEKCFSNRSRDCISAAEFEQLRDTWDTHERPYAPASQVVHSFINILFGIKPML